MKVGLDFEPVIDRLRSATGVGGTDIAVADFLGIGRSAYSARKKNRSVPYSEIVVRAAEKPFDLNYVLLGRGANEAPVSEVRESVPPYGEAPSAAPEALRLVRLYGRYSPGLERQAIVGGTNNLPCVEVPERWLEPGERYYATEVWTETMAAAGISKGDVVIVRATREPAHGAICLINVFKSGFWVREWWPQPDGSAVARGRALVASEQQETVFTAAERTDVWPLGEAVLVVKRIGQ